MVVMTRYNQRTYTIHEIAWDITCVAKFNYKGSQITYLDYYQKVSESERNGGSTEGDECERKEGR